MFARCPIDWWLVCRESWQSGGWWAAASCWWVIRPRSKSSILRSIIYLFESTNNTALRFPVHCFSFGTGSSSTMIYFHFSSSERNRTSSNYLPRVGCWVVVEDLVKFRLGTTSRFRFPSCYYMHFFVYWCSACSPVSCTPMTKDSCHHAEWHNNIIYRCIDTSSPFGVAWA